MSRKYFTIIWENTFGSLFRQLRSSKLSSFGILESCFFFLPRGLTFWGGFLGMNFWVEFLGLEYVRMRVMFCKAVKLDFENGCSNMLVELSISLIVGQCWAFCCIFLVIFVGRWPWPHDMITKKEQEFNRWLLSSTFNQPKGSNHLLRMVMEPKYYAEKVIGHPLLISWEYDDWCLGKST